MLIPFVEFGFLFLSQQTPWIPEICVHYDRVSPSDMAVDLSKASIIREQGSTFYVAKGRRRSGSGTPWRRVGLSDLSLITCPRMRKGAISIWRIWWGWRYHCAKVDRPNRTWVENSCGMTFQLFLDGWKRGATKSSSASLLERSLFNDRCKEINVARRSDNKYCWR